MYGRLFVVISPGDGHLAANRREDLAVKLIGEVGPFFFGGSSPRSLLLPINFTAISFRVSRKDDDQKLAGHVARKVRLRLEMEQTVNPEMAKSNPPLPAAVKPDPAATGQG